MYAIGPYCKPNYVIYTIPYWECVDVAMDVRRVPYSGTRRTSVARLILNSVRLAHNTRHAATAPSYHNEVNH